MGDAIQIIKWNYGVFTDTCLWNFTIKAVYTTQVAAE